MSENEKKAAEATASFLDQMSGQGFDGMSGNDFAIPFLKILQMNNPECIDGDPAYVTGAKAGMFMNTLTKRLYGGEISLIPIKYEALWLQWAPNRGGLRGRCAPGSIDVKGDPFTGLTDKDGNDVVENMVFYVLVADHLEDGPLVFPLSSTGLKHGKNWNTQISLRRLPSGNRAPYFSSVWKLKLVLNSNDDGKWYQIGTKSNTNVEWVRFITEDDFNQVVGPNKKLLDSGTARVDYAAIEAPKRDAGAGAGDATEY
jgi:hypothetical protein